MTDFKDDDNDAKTSVSLGKTVSAFNSRLKRKLKQQELEDDACQKESEARHARMLQAMNTIRKALQETCKIRLGDRFAFKMEVNDWEGWPRVELNLIDAVAPDRRDRGLVITANDRNSFGSILINERSGKLFGKVHLCDPADLNKLPLVLKKSVREFLDAIAEYVLDPIKPEALIESQTQSLDVDLIDETADDLRNAELFDDSLKDQKENTVAILEGENPLQTLPSAAHELPDNDDNLVSEEEQESEPLDPISLLRD